MVISICNTAFQELKKLTNPKTFSRYQNHINSKITSFINSNKHLLETLYNVKDNIKFTTSINHNKLDNTTQIPPFGEIFKYLATQPTFLENFSSSEQKTIQTIAKKSNKALYDFLKKDELAKKITKQYYYLSPDVKTYLETQYPSIKFHELLINSFTSFEIIEDLENNIKDLITFDINWNGREYKNFIYLFTYKLDKYSNKYSDILKLGNEIISRILFFNQYLETDKIPSKFIIFMTDNKKEIDENIINHLHFKTININTAVTNSSDIIIYRQQELLKSIFHEMIHFHNLDFRHTPEHIMNYLFKTHNISLENEYIIFESVCESLANVLNNIYLSPNIDIFKTNLEKELLFSTLQLGKILSICKYSRWGQFAQVDKTGQPDSNKQFKQDSCVFSYYVLKFYILLNLETHFKNIVPHKLKFIENDDNYNNLFQIYDMSRNDTYLETIINDMLKHKNKMNNIKMNNITNRNNKKTKKNKNHNNSHISNNYINNNKKSKIQRTLRMTCVETNNKAISKNTI